jgi:hypothetical protein
MNNNSIIEELSQYNNDAIILDGYDDAIVGIFERSVLVYDFNKIIDILMIRDNMSQTDAIEFYYYNIEQPFAKHYPIFIEKQILL